MCQEIANTCEVFMSKNLNLKERISIFLPKEAEVKE